MNEPTSPQAPTRDSVTSSDLLGRKRTDCLNALHCLYITTDCEIANDVNIKVKGYIAYLESRVPHMRPNAPLELQAKRKDRL